MEINTRNSSTAPSESTVRGHRRPHFMPRTPIGFLFIMLPMLLGCFTACRFVPLTGSAIPPLEQLEIGKNEVSNWNPEREMKIYVGQQLYTLIDGGAPQYLEKGCIKTGYQRIKGRNDALVRSTIFDFGSVINADAMYKEMKTQIAGKTVNNPTYPDSVACIKPALTTISGFAHLRNFYFELDVEGCTDQKQAIQTFNLFLGLYARKINSL